MDVFLAFTSLEMLQAELFHCVTQFSHFQVEIRLLIKRVRVFRLFEECYSQLFDPLELERSTQSPGIYDLK